MATHIATFFAVGNNQLPKVLNKNLINDNMTKFGVVGRGIMFAVVGIITVIVGSFLLRGNMHMWDKTDSEKSKEKK
jgi:hypothetical protein